MRNVAATIVFTMLLVAAVAQQPATTAPAREGYTVSGIVVDELTMEPIARASVLLSLTTGSDVRRSTRSGPDGRFSINGVARGKYSLAASFRGYPLQGYEQHENYSSAIVVGPGLDTSKILFRLEPGSSIRGRIVDEENEPVRNATVRLFLTTIEEGRASTRVVRMSPTDDLGMYSFVHLSPGSYYVAVMARPWYVENGRGMQSVMMMARAMADGQQPSPAMERAMQVSADEQRAMDRTFPVTFFGDVTDWTAAAQIRLQPGENATANVTLRSVQAVHLRLPPPEHAPDSAGDPTRKTPNAMPDGISVGGGGGGTFRTSMGRRGARVDISQPVFGGTLIHIPAAYVGGGGDAITVGGLAPGRYLVQTATSAPAGDENAVSGSYMELEINGDMDLPGGASPAATLSGTAQFEGEKKVPFDVTIALRNLEISRAYPMRPDEKGEFEPQQQLIPGRYELSVGSSSGWYLKSATATGAKLVGRTLTIASGDNAHLSLTLAHGIAQVTGTALRNGAPKSGAMIVLVPRNAENSAVLFRRDQSDSDGTFLLRDVVPGDYTLLAIDDGWKLPFTEPKALNPYLKNGEAVHVAPSAKLDVKVNVQNR